jgi:ubiquinone/menaquinone biosynthesis C-methylase UbiE
VAADERRWNHNIHYHRLLLDAVPERCLSALDVGCGEGILARELRRSVARVSAIDVDAGSIEIARRCDPTAEIDYRLGDSLGEPFEAASFDYVVCVAALHQMDAEAALQRMRALLRPGGTLAVLGLARSRYPIDLPRDLVAVVVSRTLRLARACWESSAPTIWPPPDTYRDVQRLAERELPGARFRRLLLFRYSITWTKPLP